MPPRNFSTGTFPRVRHVVSGVFRGVLIVLMTAYLEVILSRRWSFCPRRERYAFGFTRFLRIESPASPCNGRCARTGRGCHRPASDRCLFVPGRDLQLRSQDLWSALGSGPRRSPRSRGVRVHPGRLVEVPPESRPRSSGFPKRDLEHSHRDAGTVYLPRPVSL
jgi:hypothetical protein